MQEGQPKTIRFFCIVAPMQKTAAAWQSRTHTRFTEPSSSAEPYLWHTAGADGNERATNEARRLSRRANCDPLRPDARRWPGGVGRIVNVSNEDIERLSHRAAGRREAGLCLYEL